MGKSRGTIAVVDDDAGVRTALRQLLRSAGFDAIAFESAESFLANAKQLEIRCLIADINLPGMSGVELLRRLADIGGSPRVVLITGRDDAHTLDLISRAAAVPLLRKPFSDEALFEAIDHTDERKYGS
jgi:FixJ family two-component response regulator